VNLFRSGGGYVIALTYGRDRDWVKNVLAAGGCRVESRGGTMHLTDPRIVKDETLALVPPPIRLILKAFGVAQFMELKTESDDDPPDGRANLPCPPSRWGTVVG
jgi:hypothetical protein